MGILAFPLAARLFAVASSPNLHLPSRLGDYHLIANPLEGLPEALVLQGSSHLLAERLGSSCIPEWLGIVRAVGRIQCRIRRATLRLIPLRSSWSALKLDGPEDLWDGRSRLLLVVVVGVGRDQAIHLSRSCKAASAAGSLWVAAADSWWAAGNYNLQLVGIWARFCRECIHRLTACFHVHSDSPLPQRKLDSLQLALQMCCYLKKMANLCSVSR